MAANKTPTKDKLSPGPRCSVCSSPHIDKINSAINSGASIRGIAGQYGLSKSSAQRHTENCLKLEIQALIKQKKIARAINHYEEITEQLEFAKDLRIAARAYLSDEHGNIVLIPRDDEIEVVYSEFVTRGEKPGWVKKVERLDILLEKIENGDRNVQRVIAKHIDIRQFALNAISSVDLVLDKIAKVEGLYSKERENNETLQKVVTAFQNWLEDNPKASEREKSLWVERFAKGGGVGVSELAQKVGVHVIEGVQ